MRYIKLNMYVCWTGLAASLRAIFRSGLREIHPSSTQVSAMMLQKTKRLTNGDQKLCKTYVIQNKGLADSVGAGRRKKKGAPK